MLGNLLDSRYRIMQTLGAGGFGQTYLAEDTKLPGNPHCVVKQLKPYSTDLGTLQIARRLFDSEAQVLQQLGEYEQIPRLLAFFEEKKEFFLVQQFINGHPLSTELTPGRRFNEEEVIALLDNILIPLTFVHRHQIIHRDLKPANLIRRVQDNKIFLIDFGAVKEVAVTQVTSQGHSQLTVSIGTPGYMPSEQTRGIPRLSSDVYALGVIAIQALTGLMPHQLTEDPDTAEIIWRPNVQVSDRFADILDKMVCYDFRQRYQSASEVLQALQQSQSLPTVTFIPNNTNLVSQLTLEWFEAGQLKTQKIIENQQTKNQGIFRIGRDPSACDLVLSEITVSRQHVDIFFDQQKQCFCLRNLNNNNLPLLNGQFLSESELVLNLGDVFRLGQAELKVVDISRNQYPSSYIPTSPPAQAQANIQPPITPIHNSDRDLQYPPPPVQAQYKQEIVTPASAKQSLPTSPKPAQWLFWFKWCGLNIGGFITAILAGTFASAIGLPTMLQLMSFAAVAGVFQWLALRNQIKNAMLWSIITGVISIGVFTWIVIVPIVGIVAFLQFKKETAEN
ncbi:serine/threonine protein kinase [Calothrix sp. NIES-4101]|nr:serine/threonine protein kinase [Calothrix sp. NIES-4101]